MTRARSLWILAAIVTTLVGAAVQSVIFRPSWLLGWLQAGYPPALVSGVLQLQILAWNAAAAGLAMACERGRPKTIQGALAVLALQGLPWIVAVATFREAGL